MDVYSVSIDPEAKKQIEKAINWSNLQFPGLGSKIWDQFQSLIKSLQKNPRRHAIRYRNVHSVPLKNRPFTIHYTIDDDRKIVAIRDFIDDRTGPNLRPREN